MDTPFLPGIVEREIGSTVVATVDGRQLHAALRVGSSFRHWMKRRIASARLREGRDYAMGLSVKFDRKSEKRDSSRMGRSSVEYALSIDAAKAVALMEGNDVGKAIRAHFIRCEEGLRTADPHAHAESVDRMREKIADRTADGDEGGKGGGIDPSVTNRLVEHVLALSSANMGLVKDVQALTNQVREHADREIEALRSLHREQRDRADALDAEMRRRDAAARATARAGARDAGETPSRDGEYGTDDVRPPDAPLDEAGLEAVLANLPKVNPTLRKASAGDEDRRMALVLAGCTPVQPRPFRFWRAEHGSPGVAKGANHSPGRATRGGNTYEMRRAAVRIFDALQEQRRTFRHKGTKH